MSSDDLLNKEKSSVINLDSESDFDKKSLAKSIEINYLENEKLTESPIKETEKNNFSNEEEQLKNSNFSCNKKEENLFPNEAIKSSNTESGIKLSNVNYENEDENLLIFENPCDFKSLFNCSKFVEGDYNLIKNSAQTNINNYNYNNNLFERKMGSEANVIKETNKYTIADNDKNNNTNTNSDNIKTEFTKNNKQNEKQKKTLLQKFEILDKNLSLIIQDLHLGRNLDFLIYIFARLFNPDFIISYFLFILSYKIYSNNDFYFVLKPIASTVFSLSITLFLKKQFGRLRPDYSKKSKRIFDLRRHEKNCSMPSGDSLQAANFSMILFFYFNSYFGFFLIPFVMFARVYFYCHFVFDTIVGAVLGIFSSCLVYFFISLC